jgi:putative NADPH-quinone reductase
MPNYLFVISHPDLKGQSTSHQLANAAKAALTSAGHQVRVVDLIRAGFNVGASPSDFVNVPGDKRLSYAELQTPDNISASIKEQQANVDWASHVIVFGPIWFYRYPASFSAYTERVFTPGWAYDMELPREKLGLYGKKILFVMTTGGPSEFYAHAGPLTSLEGLLYTTTFAYYGMGFQVYRSQGVWQSAVIPKEAFAEVVRKFTRALLNLEKRPLLPFADPAKKAGVDELQVFAELANIELDEAIAF